MSVFRFKRFTVQQHHSAMKVGTDGVLLGAWAMVDKGKTILDIGAGSGVIALMLAQRFPGCGVHAIEIDPEAFEQSLINIANAPFGDRVQAFHASLDEWMKFTAYQYDMIVCNPPYFDKGFRVEDAKRKKARDASWLPHKQLTDVFEKMTPANGILSVIMPVEEGKKFTEHCTASGYYCRRKTTVYSKPGKPAIRWLMEFIKQPVAIIEDELNIGHEGQNDFTEAYKELTKEFYLKF